MNDVTRSKSGAWFWTTLREAGVFLKTSFGSLASIEFATVLLPLLALWELAPRLGWVPRTLVPPASQVAATLWDLFARHGLSRHVGLSLGRFLLGLGAAVAFALPIGVRVFIFAESLGGVESLITHPLAQTHADLPREVCERVGINNRLLRLSVGIEDADDLIRDLEALL